MSSSVVVALGDLKVEERSEGEELREAGGEKTSADRPPLFDRSTRLCGGRQDEGSGQLLLISTFTTARPASGTVTSREKTRGGS